MDQLENQMGNENIHWNKKMEIQYVGELVAVLDYQDAILNSLHASDISASSLSSIAWLPISFLWCSISCLPTGADESQMGHWLKVGVSKLIHLCQAHCCELTKHMLTMISLTWWGFAASIQKTSKRNLQLWYAYHFQICCSSLALRNDFHSWLIIFCILAMYLYVCIHKSPTHNMALRHNLESHGK